MFRLFFTFILPLIAPTVLYLAWNWVQLRRSIAGKRPGAPPSFAEAPWMVLVGAGISLVIVVLLGFALFGGGAAPSTKYVPPRYEDGRVVPAENR